MSDLQYVIIGAGGTGGGIGAYMAAAGKHVTLIARGAHPVRELTDLSALEPAQLSF